MDIVRDFIFLGSKITTDGDCSHEIKRHLLLGRKAMTNLDKQHVKKQRHYFANKGPSSQSYGFSSIMYECENWIVKIAEGQRIDAFENCGVGEDSCEALGQFMGSQKNETRLGD